MLLHPIGSKRTICCRVKQMHQQSPGQGAASTCPEEVHDRQRADTQSCRVAPAATAANSPRRGGGCQRAAQHCEAMCGG